MRPFENARNAASISRTRQRKPVPRCGTKIVGPQGANVWVGALVQIAISTAFMLAFGFPRIMIAIFGD